MNLRAHSLLIILNNFRHKIVKLDDPAARRYFEKVSKPLWKVKLANVHDETVTIGEQPSKLRFYENGLTDNLIIYFHGGGWAVGSLDSHDQAARLLAKKTGSTVLSVEYSLAPEAKYPTQIEEGSRVLTWATHRYHDKKIFITGDSAGANLALYVAKDAPANTLTGMILMYPVLDPSCSSASMDRYATRYFVTKKDMLGFWKMYLGDHKLSWPLDTTEIKKLPRTLIMTVQYDILNDEGRIFYEQLKDSGIETSFFSVKDTVHGLLQMPNILSHRNKYLSKIAQFINS